MNPKNQQPPTSESNPPALEDAPVHAGTPWSRAGMMSGNLFKIRKDWPVPPSTNTSTNITIKPSLPTIKTNLKTQISQNPVQLQQDRKDADGDQIAPFAKMQRRTGMESIRSSSNSLMYSRSFLPKAKTESRSRTPNTTRTTKYHKVSTPKYPLMCLTDMLNKHT